MMNVCVCVCICLYMFMCVCLYVCLMTLFILSFQVKVSNAFLNVMQYLEVRWLLILKNISNIFNIVFTLKFDIIHIHPGRKKPGKNKIMLY